MGVYTSTDSLGIEARIAALLLASTLAKYIECVYVIVTFYYGPGQVANAKAGTKNPRSVTASVPNPRRNHRQSHFYLPAAAVLLDASKLDIK